MCLAISFSCSISSLKISSLVMIISLFGLAVHFSSMCCWVSFVVGSIFDVNGLFVFTVVVLSPLQRCGENTYGIP